MDKKAWSESDICDKYIRPAMQAAGWYGLGQIYREFPLRADLRQHCVSHELLVVVFVENSL